MKSASNTLAGIISVTAGMMFFVVQDGMMKALLQQGSSIWMLIFTRAFIAVLILTPLVLIAGPPHRLRSPLFHLHLARASLFTIGFSLFYTAFPFMELAALTTIFFAGPLFTALLAVVFLGERMGLRRIACLLAGFIGVAIAMSPAGGDFQWVALLPLICALTYAVSQIIARRIGERETTMTMGLYTLAFSGMLIVPMGYLVSGLFDFGTGFEHLRWNWQFTISAWDISVLILLGLTGMAGYLLVSRAYQIANASLIAPFDYTYMPFAAVMAYLIWGEVPGWNVLLGMFIIIASGLYLGYREILAERQSGQAPPTAQTVFTPGNPTGQIAHAKDTRR